MATYHEAFVRYAKRRLSHWDFRILHHKAHSAAGGAAARQRQTKPADDEEEAEKAPQQSPEAAIVSKALGSVANALTASSPFYAVAKSALGATACKAVSAPLPIINANLSQHVLYCVGLEPDTYDFQNDAISAEEIAKTAHKFLTESKTIGSMHTKRINATPVESYIAPQDLSFSGPYGDQIVRKGSWVLAIKVHDPEEWGKVVSGHYTGISVGGFGQHQTVEEDEE